MATVPFIDVGDSQGSVDWGKARAAGIVLASCKATEGEDFRAKTFSGARVKSIHAEGLPLMPYHYLRPRTDRSGSKEAAWAVAVMRDAGWRPHGPKFPHGKDAPMVLDLEWQGNQAMLAKMTGPQVRRYAEEFAGTVLDLTGRRVMSYLSPGFAAELGNDDPTAATDVWVAAYSAAKGKPPTPAGFKAAHVRAHQWTSTGTWPGVSVAVDVDAWLGDGRSVAAWIAGRPAPNGGGGGAPSPGPDMTIREAQRLLRKIGWPVGEDGVRGPKTAQAIKDFQLGWAIGKPLLVDGLVGPKTAAALRDSAAHGGRVSAHFTYKEFASSHTGWMRVHRALVVGLEKLRAYTGRPIGVLSGFRDFELGASHSQHHYGNAIDPTAALPHYTEVAKLKVFSGIGYHAASGLVRHVDVRHVGPNFTGGTPARPTVFVDAF
jgi:lysozyme